MTIAECLRPKRSVLRSNHHGQRIVQSQRSQHQHRRRQEERLWRGMALSNLEDSNPKESNANRSNANNGAAEE